MDLKSTINIESQDPNICFNKFESKINTLIEKYMPLKKLSRKEIKQKFKPWITKDIRKAIITREKLYKKFIRAKDQERKLNIHKQYKELRNNIVSIIRKSKSQYFKQFFTKNASNAKNTWDGIKSIINFNNSSKSELSSLMVDNKISTDPKIIANTFNKYFSTVADKLQDKIFHTSHDFKNYLTNGNNNSFFINPTDKDEIIDILITFNINKTSGPHSIPIKILHVIKHIIAEPLALIINLSFETGI